MRFGLQASHEMAYNTYGCKCDASVTPLFFQSHFHSFQWLLVYTNPNQSVDFGGPAIEKKMKRMGHSKVLI